MLGHGAVQRSKPLRPANRTHDAGLDEVVQAARGRNLFFSTNVTKHVAEADIVFVRWAEISTQRCVTSLPAQ